MSEKWNVTFVGDEEKIIEEYTKMLTGIHDYSETELQAEVTKFRELLRKHEII